MKQVQLFSFLLLACGALFVFGCSAKKPKFQPQKVNANTETQPPVEEVMVSREDVFITKMKGLQFVGKRDLFKSVEMRQGPAGSSGGTPLEAFELGQLKVVGIIWGTSRPWALVKTPDNDEYRATINTAIGKNGGKVISILQDQVVILEQFYDYRGELQKEKYTLRLPISEGAN